MCLFCGSYRCTRCRNPKLKRVRARLAQIAQEHKLQRMATLTLDPDKIPAKYRARTDRYIRDCWCKMRVLLARKFGGSLPFVAVLEFHQSGRAHLHVLLAQFIKQEWLSAAWESIGGGRIVDIRYVDVHRVSAYLAVYLAGEKIVHTLELLARRARIFTTARCIRLWPKKEASGWRLRRSKLSELYERAENPSGERWEAIEELKVFGLKLLTYFESPPCEVAFCGLDVIPAWRKALPIWRQEKPVSRGKPGEFVKPIKKG